MCIFLEKSIDSSLLTSFVHLQIWLNFHGTFFFRKDKPLYVGKEKKRS